MTVLVTHTCLELRISSSQDFGTRELRVKERYLEEAEINHAPLILSENFSILPVYKLRWFLKAAAHSDTYQGRAEKG